MSSRVSGRIRKWVAEKGWGLVYSYSELTATSAPIKHFLHLSKLLHQEDISKLRPGVKVSFVSAAPRSEGDLPQAVEVLVEEAQ